MRIDTPGLDFAQSKRKAVYRDIFDQHDIRLFAGGNMVPEVVLEGNEIGMDVIPMGAEVRTFVDVLGQLKQHVAQACARRTWMAAGLPLTLKATP